MKKITSFEEACTALSISPALPDFSMIPERDQKAMLAHYKLVIIARAMNDGWEPNWNDFSEWKYFPWFEVKASKSKPSGSGFSYSRYGHSNTRTNVGSRLCFKTSDLALQAGEQFEDLYKEYFLLS